MFFMHRSCWHIVDSVYTYMFGNRACCRWKRSRSCRPCVRGSSPASYTPPWQEKRWNSSTRGAQCKSGKFDLVCVQYICLPMTSSRNTHLQQDICIFVLELYVMLYIECLCNAMHKNYLHISKSLMK